MVAKKSAAKRKRVDDTAHPQVPSPSPSSSKPEMKEKKSEDKKKKVEESVEVPGTNTNKEKKTEKRKREEEETPTATPTQQPSTKETSKESTTASKPNESKAQEKENEKVSESVVNGNGETKIQKTLEPPHNLHLARRLNVVKCRVDLYKIPPQYINFEPTKTHFYLDTLKYSKKYLLKVPYPEGVSVNTEVEVTFDSGVLKCDLPILSDPNKPKGHDEVVAAREKIKEMRQKGIPASIDLIAAAKLAKTKADKQGTASSDDTSASASTSPAPKQQKKAKKPLSNKERRQKEKANRPLNEDGTEVPRQKKPKTEKKKKEFLNNPEQALQMADQVNDQQEKAIQDKYDKEYAKLSYETRKKIENKEKKTKLREQRKQELEKAVENMPKKEKRKKSATKVSFAEQE